uniref:Uncharacterized protein n=2 Tax=Anguilla anguilla TaxID=7936 RepID=A0A0E9RXP4_ANGAN
MHLAVSSMYNRKALIRVEGEL